MVLVFRTVKMIPLRLQRSDSSGCTPSQQPVHALEETNDVVSLKRVVDAIANFDRLASWYIQKAASGLTCPKQVMGSEVRVLYYFV